MASFYITVSAILVYLQIRSFPVEIALELNSCMMKHFCPDCSTLFQDANAPIERAWKSCKYVLAFAVTRSAKLIYWKTTFWGNMLITALSTTIVKTSKVNISSAQRAWCHMMTETLFSVSQLRLESCWIDNCICITYFQIAVIAIKRQ